MRPDESYGIHWCLLRRRVCAPAPPHRPRVLLVNLLVGTAAGAFSLDDPGQPLIAGVRINHVHRAGDGWWAVGEDGGVYRDGERVTTTGDATLNCVLALDGDVWVGASEARLFRLEDDDLVEDPAFASAPGRQDWYTPWGGPPDVRSLAADAEGTLFVNVHVGGILRYDRDGLSPTLDQDADVHQVITDPDHAGTVLAACARGLAQSTDGGGVFGYRDDGLHAAYCRAVAVVEDTVLVSASTGPRSNRARLYRAPLTSGPFEPCTDGLPGWFEENLDSHCLAVVDGDAYAGQRDKVWRSDDGGVTWVEAGSGLPPITCIA